MEGTLGFFLGRAETAATGFMMRILLLLLSSLMFATAQEKPMLASEVPNFELPDQHEKMRQVHFPREKPTMFIVSDQKGSDQIAPWVRPIRHDIRRKLKSKASRIFLPSRPAYGKLFAEPSRMNWITR